MSDLVQTITVARSSIACMKSLLAEGTERMSKLDLAMRVGKPDLIDDELEGLRVWQARVETYLGLSEPTTKETPCT